MSDLAQQQAKQKTCTRCGADVAGRKRVKDGLGRYFCEPCWQTEIDRVKHLQDLSVTRVPTPGSQGADGQPFCENCGGRFDETALAISGQGKVLCSRCHERERMSEHADAIRAAQVWVPHTVIATLVLGPLVVPAQVWLAVRISSGTPATARGVWITACCLPWLGAIALMLLSRHVSGVLGPAWGHRSTHHGNVKPHVRDIALCQRQLLWAIVFGMIAMILFPLLLVAIPYQIWRTFKLANALGFNAVLWSIAAFVPYVGILFLLVLNSQATAMLKDAGLRVGLMGARLDD